MSKLLLTSVIRPFGGPGEGDSVGAELFHAQVTRAQGPFSLRQVIRCWAIDYLAGNLTTPTVTLHYPSRRELVRELKTGGYSHVGINFVVATFHKVREMVALIRRHAPGAKVVLGGYGSVLPDELLAPFSDYVCREEGVGYLRALLGEPAGAPICHPHAPIPAVRVLSHQKQTVVGHVTAGLGCPNGCDFCSTSHFFKRKYLPFLERGRDVYEALIATRNKARADGQEMTSFILIDEDFFLHHARAREFLESVKEGGESFGVMGFGSVRGVSRFTAREIAQMGFDLIWNAFEGKKAGYRKQEGRPLAEMYRELTSVGCAQLTSMIIGFPYQNEQTVLAEFDELMSLEPAMIQCLIYFAFPGTPFHEQVIKEERYLSSYRATPDLRRWDGFAMHFHHPLFAGPGAIESLQKRLYRSDFERLGPTPLRFARVALSGYQTLKNDPDPLLAARAERLRATVRGAFPAISSAILFAPSSDARARAIALREDVIRMTGAPSVKERAMEAASPLMYLATRAADALGLLQQPGLLRTSHRMEGDSESQRTQHAMRLQGGRASGIGGAGRALVEDTLESLRRMAGRLGTQLPPPAAARLVTSRAQEMLPSR